MNRRMLTVPFVSRFDADGARLDCGACCAAMLLGAMAQAASAAEIAAAAEVDLAPGRTGCRLSPSALIRGAAAFELTLFKAAGYTFEDLKRLVDDGQPPIALLRYGEIPDRLERRCTAEHYVAVVGYDDETAEIFINDPHYPEASGGYRRAYSYPVFMAAWSALGNVLLVPVPVAVAALDAAAKSVPAPRGAAPEDLWVIAPLGLRVRSEPDAQAGAVAATVTFGQHVLALGPETAVDAKSYTWRQIQTDSGARGWVAASMGGDRYLGAQPPIAPYQLYVLNTPATRHAGGLSARKTRDVQGELLESVPIGGRVVIYGRVTEADGTPWLWVKTPGEKFGWAREQAEGVMLVGPAPKMERGAHCSPITSPIPNLIPRLQELNIRWYKMMDGGDAENLTLVTELKQAGIEPIVRLYQGGQFPGRLSPNLRQRFGALRAAGATYVEIGNEPNHPDEWRGPHSWQNAAQVNELADNWYLDAQEAIQAGLKPAIYAMAPTERDRGINDRYSSVKWLTGMMQRLAATHFAEVKGWLATEQIWLAVHTADFSHDFDYDPFAGGIDDMCLRGYEVARKIVFDVFGVWPVTISTEGGVYSPKHMRDIGWDPKYSDAEWGPRLKAMFEYPLELRAMCPWTFSDEGVHDDRWLGCGWYDEHGNPRSPIAALRIS